jgi:hypothetical protein
LIDLYEPTWRRKRRLGPILACEHCGKSFAQKPHTVGRFCDVKCWYEFRRAATASPPCAHCGRPIVTTDHAYRRKYCSNACFGASCAKPRINSEPAAIPGARWIQLSNGRFTLVDEADCARLADRLWVCRKGTAYHDRKDGTPKAMHRFLTGVTDPSVKVDHRNGNPLDNRR